MSQDRINIKEIPTQAIKIQDKPLNPSQKIYVRAVQGTYQRLRRYMGSILIMLFLAVPWLNYGDRQAILLDIEKQQFYFFGTTFWPQDLTLLLATIFMISAFGLFFITTFLGRVWCGYLCPQTVWTFIYIWFEERLEGAANKRRRQDSLPMTANLLLRKLLKHLAWLIIALITSLSFIGYFVPIDTLFIAFFSGDTTGWLLFWVMFFTLCTYANAGWMRSIVCLHMCPYARFQSVMFDKDSYIVGYDSQRGEQRGPRSRKVDLADLELGQCIDCDLCVQVCPTGIDIREGLQYECINCGACADACDQTMNKMGYPTKLISYTTENQLLGKQTQIIRPKLIGYGLAMLTMVGVFVILLNSIQPMELDVIRDRSQLFKENDAGLIENTYTLKIINKRQQPTTFKLNVSGADDIQWYGPQAITLKAGEISSIPISLAIDPYLLTQSIIDIEFIVTVDENNNQHVFTTESRFIGGYN